MTGYSWKLLLFFTRKQHIGIFSAALGAAALVSALRTLLSIVLGRVFDIISQLGQGARTGQIALADVSTWCLVLVGLGIGSWMVNSSFLGLWIIFGELQAREARRLVFTSLLSKRPEWFAALNDGVRDFTFDYTRKMTLIRINTVTFPYRLTRLLLGKSVIFSWQHLRCSDSSSVTLLHRVLHLL